MEYYNTHAKICAGCGGNNRIHLHHRTYDNFGHEKDIDLLPLCYWCHRTLHNIQAREKISVEAATKVFMLTRKKVRKNANRGKRQSKSFRNTKGRKRKRGKIR